MRTPRAPLEWAADAAADPLPFPVVPAPRPSLADTDRELTIVDTRRGPLRR